MKLHQFIQMMHKAIGCEKTQSDYVLYLTNLILREPLTDEEDKAEEQDRYNPLSGNQASNLSKIYSGKRSISKQRAKAMMQRISKERFSEELLYTTSEETKDYLTAELMKHGFAVDASCVHDVCAMVFEGLLNALADGQKELHPEDIGRHLAIDEFEVPLLIEANCRCPLDRKPLLMIVKNKQLKKYRVVDIKQERASGTSLAMSHGLEGKVALCEDCADEYEIDPDDETYHQLIELKEEMVKGVRLNDLLRTLQLEDGLREVVQRITEFRDPDGLEDFDYKLLTLDEKIQPGNFPLRDRVEKSALTYYNFIKGLLHGNERITGSSSDLIASQIHVCYENLKKETDDQDEIFESIVSWVMDSLGLAKKLRYPCEVVVSYYVQSCEVFHEAS